MGGWWRWALVSPDGVAPSRMVSLSASVNLPLYHKVQKLSSGPGSPGWSQKKGRKTVVVVVVVSSRTAECTWMHNMIKKTALLCKPHSADTITIIGGYRLSANTEYRPIINASLMWRVFRWHSVDTKSCLAGWRGKVLRCCSVVRASNTYCCHCRLESLTLKRFIITDSLGLDKLTWLKLLHIVDSVTDSLVSTSLHCLSAWRSYSILFCPYSVYCQLCKNTMNIRIRLTCTAFLTCCGWEIILAWTSTVYIYASDILGEDRYQYFDAVGWATGRALGL